MNPNTPSITLLFERIASYEQTTLELIKLSFVDKFAEIVSSIVFQIIIGFLIFMFALTLNVGAAFWIGDLMGKTYLGFFMVAFFYAIITSILFSFGSNLIKERLVNKLIVVLLYTLKHEKNEPKRFD